MAERKSLATFRANNDERTPFDDDENPENINVYAEKSAQKQGGGVKPPPDRPIGAELLHPEANGNRRWLKRIYDPAPAAAELASDDFEGPGQDKLVARTKALRQMADDPMLGWRPMIMATDAMIGDLDALAATAPNFRRLFDIVLAAARASRHAAMPLRLPPILLVGPPGAGKTRAAYAIAGALGTSVEKVPVTLQTGAGVLSGLDWTWRTPSMGAVAKALLATKTASPIVIIDEIDKSCPRSEYGQLLDPLHDLLEVDTAREFEDEYLKMPLASDALLWLATANDIDAIPAPILDRMLVIQIDQPNRHEMGVILEAMIQAAMKRWGDWFPAKIDVDAATLAALRVIHPRAARRIIDLAVGFAVAAGRRAVLPEDVERARVITIGLTTKRKIGFL
ncbi:AAA family ATPase [Rhabdaerophilum sp. SD176]|uniref:AAA family ATPase n=1 Tax=Rhabdaerophilum sp. SD176 TaxID=2983548 RepID=UPI0024DFBA76|nr:AAA family ATPase [Rhabdaerophilum sp. SD176]